MSDRYHAIKVGSVWLTKDGLETGVNCKTNVTGLENLLSDFTGQTQYAIDNTTYIQVAENVGVGTKIGITMTRLESGVMTSLKSEINTAINTDTPFNVTIEGSAGDFDLECLPDFPQFTWPGEMMGGALMEVTLNLVVQEIN